MFANELTAYLVPSDTVGSYPFADKKHCMGSQIIRLHDHPDATIHPTDILIVGIDARDSDSPSNLIRKQLWGLSSIHYPKGRVFDAGNIPANLTLAQQYQAVETISAMLTECKAQLIFIGGTQEFTSKVYSGWRISQKFIRLAIIDCKIDWDGNYDDFHEDNFVNNLMDEPYEKLVDLSFIGIQGYLTPQHIQQRVLRRKHEHIRLGNLRGNIHEAEPLLFDAHLVSIDMSAVRASDAPGLKVSNPNGLYAEEVCMLARYAGVGQNSKFFGLFGLGAIEGPQKQTIMLAAQVVWHYIEGVSHRKLENPLKNLPYNKKYVINIDVPGIEMVFYKNEHSGNWWFELAGLNKRKLMRGKILVRCTASDYTSASNGDIPQRWMRWYQKVQKI